MTYTIKSKLTEENVEYFEVIRYGKTSIDSFDSKLQAELAAVALNLASVLSADEYDQERTLEYLKAILDKAYAEYLIEQYENGNM